MAAPAPRLLMLAQLAWRNVWRNPTRSGLTLAAMGFGLMMSIVLAALYEGITRQMVRVATELSLGHVQVQRAGYVDEQDLYATLPDALVARLERETPFRYAPRSYAAALASAGDYSTGVRLTAIDPAREAAVTTLHEHLREGEYRFEPVATGRDGSPEYGIVIGLQLARNLRVGVGHDVVLITQAADGSIGNGLFRVRGILKPVDAVSDRAGVMLSMAGYQALMALQGGVHELAISVGDAALAVPARERVAAVVAAWQAEAGGEQARMLVRTWGEINPGLHDMVALTRTMMGVMAVIVLGVAALGLLNTQIMSLHERTHEFGILMSLGMGRAWLLAMMLLEVVFLALVAAAAGTLAGSLWSLRLETHGWDFSSYLPDGLDWAGITMEPVYRTYLRPFHVELGLAVLFGVSLIAALAASWRTARLNPVEALHR